MMNRNDMLFWMGLGGLAINTMHGELIGGLCSLVAVTIAYWCAPRV